MNPYLSETEFAVQNLFTLATEEKEILAQKISKLTSAQKKAEMYKWDFETSDLNEDFSEVYVMDAYAKMAEANKDSEELRRDISTLEAQIGTLQLSFQVINGAIIQIAKQGISLIHKELQLAPAGRLIGSTSVRDIVWQARSQAMHYEETIKNKHVIALFALLENENGSNFSLTKHPLQSRATQVIELLGWNDYSAYLDDMTQLLP